MGQINFEVKSVQHPLIGVLAADLVVYRGGLWREWLAFRAKTTSWRATDVHGAERSTDTPYKRFKPIKEGQAVAEVLLRDLL